MGREGINEGGGYDLSAWKCNQWLSFDLPPQDGDEVEQRVKSIPSSSAVV